MIARKRRYLQCEHCSIYFPLDVVHIHESRCDRNPRPTITTFRSLGKKFMVKPDAPKALPAPPLRVAAVQYVDGRTYPVLLDDILDLYNKEPLLILDTVSYRYKGIEIQCFRVRNNITPTQAEEDFYSAVWSIIVKARKAGAELYD